MINDQLASPTDLRRRASAARALAAAVDAPADAAWLEALADRLSDRRRALVRAEFTGWTRVEARASVHAWSPRLRVSACGQPKPGGQPGGEVAVTCRTCLRILAEAAA